MASSLVASFSLGWRTQTSPRSSPPLSRGRRRGGGEYIGRRRELSFPCSTSSGAASSKEICGEGTAVKRETGNLLRGWERRRRRGRLEGGFLETSYEKRRRRTSFFRMEREKRLEHFRQLFSSSLSCSSSFSSLPFCPFISRGYSTCRAGRWRSRPSTTQPLPPSKPPAEKDNEARAALSFSGFSHLRHRSYSSSLSRLNTLDGAFCLPRIDSSSSCSGRDGTSKGPSSARCSPSFCLPQTSSFASASSSSSSSPPPLPTCSSLSFPSSSSSVLLRPPCPLSRSLSMQCLSSASSPQPLRFFSHASLSSLFSLFLFSPPTDKQVFMVRVRRHPTGASQAPPGCLLPHRPSSLSSSSPSSQVRLREEGQEEERDVETEAPRGMSRCQLSSPPEKAPRPLRFSSSLSLLSCSFRHRNAPNARRIQAVYSPAQDERSLTRSFLASSSSSSSPFSEVKNSSASFSSSLSVFSYQAPSRRFFSSGFPNTKRRMSNPFWRRRGWWKWRQREVKTLNRAKRLRKHLFPRFKTGTVAFVDKAELEYRTAMHAFKKTGRLNGRTVVPGVEGARMRPLRHLVHNRGKRLEARRRAVEEEEEERERKKRKRRRMMTKKRGEIPSSFTDNTEKERAGAVLGSDDDDDDDEYLWKKKGGGKMWEERKANIPLGKKRLLLYCQVIKGEQITDAIDWLSSLCLHRVNYLLNLLMKTRQKIFEEGGDISRVYVQSYLLNIQGRVKRPQFRLKSVSFIKTWKFAVILRFRELPMEEYFHRLFILKKVPRSLTTDMRLAITEHRVSPSTVRDWYPYLDAKTRFWHRQRLKWLDRTRQFDYHLARRVFRTKYELNCRRRKAEILLARGVSPETIQQQQEEADRDSE